jgi:hypothetical protein
MLTVEPPFPVPDETMTRPPKRDTAPPAGSTPPDANRQQRVQRGLALMQRMSTGRTAEGFQMCGTCPSCGAKIHDWRDHVRGPGSRTVYSKDNGEFTARIEYDGACPACGGNVVEVRAEGR